MVSESGEFHKGVEIDFLNSGGWEPRSVSWHLEGANTVFPQEEGRYPTIPSSPAQIHLGHCPQGATFRSATWGFGVTVGSSCKSPESGRMCPLHLPVRHSPSEQYTTPQGFQPLSVSHLTSFYKKNFIFCSCICAWACAT